MRRLFAGEYQLLFKAGNESKIWSIPEDMMNVNETPNDAFWRILKTFTVNWERETVVFEKVGDVKAWPLKTRNTPLYRLYLVEPLPLISSHQCSFCLSWLGDRELKNTGVELSSIVPLLTTKYL
ncbi:MAG: hypothetical protein AAB589_02930 [Patescibacteria group bacterium]